MIFDAEIFRNFLCGLGARITQKSLYTNSYSIISQKLLILWEGTAFAESIEFYQISDAQALAAWIKREKVSAFSLVCF